MPYCLICQFHPCICIKMSFGQVKAAPVKRQTAAHNLAQFITPLSKTQEIPIPEPDLPDFGKDTFSDMEDEDGDVNDQMEDDQDENGDVLTGIGMLFHSDGIDWKEMEDGYIQAYIRESNLYIRIIPGDVPSMVRTK